MAAPLYRGFSTVANNGIDTRLFDVNLVTQDLLNHFSTRVGERVGRPSFGSIIHDLLFDLFDTRTEGLVIADAQRIFSEDPRVVPLEVNVEVDPEKHQIRLVATLQMVEFDTNINFHAIFEARG
jgi:phage baseplate assembly protein W